MTPTPNGVIDAAGYLGSAWRWSRRRSRIRRSPGPEAPDTAGNGDRSTRACTEKNREPRSLVITCTFAHRGHRAGRKACLPPFARIVHHGCMFTSEAVTRGVRVQVTRSTHPSVPIPAKTSGSSSTRSRSPTTGAKPSSCSTRHWIITDGDGNVEEVRGPGVVGKQPMLKPGESFEYTSGCPLTTAVRRDGRHLPDGHRRRRAVRREDRAVHAERAVYGALSTTPSSERPTSNASALALSCLALRT